MSTKERNLTNASDQSRSGANVYIVIGVILTVLIGWVTQSLENAITLGGGFLLLCIFAKNFIDWIGRLLFGVAKTGTGRLVDTAKKKLDTYQTISKIDQELVEVLSTSMMLSGSQAKLDSPVSPQSYAVASKQTDDTFGDMLTLQDLARCSTILLVGNRGSGKSVLLNALLATRNEDVLVYDPHAAPSDWPMASTVYNDEDAIASGLVYAYETLETRKDERRKGVRLQNWPKFTLAADEWSSIISNVDLPKEHDLTPGMLSGKLMKEGRKFDIGFIAGAHGTTNKNLGCEGDNEAFLQSFDWIIYMGGFARKMYTKEYASIWQHVPLGTNPQGGTFPLIVLCVSPSTGETKFLDMRGFPDIIKRVPARMRKQTPVLQTTETIDLREETDRRTASKEEIELVRWWLDENPKMSTREIARRLYCFREGLDYSVVYPGGRVGLTVEGRYDGSGDLSYRAENARSRL